MLKRALLCQWVLWVASVTAFAAPQASPDRPNLSVTPEVSVPTSFIPPGSFLFSVGVTTGINPAAMQAGSLSVGYQFRRMALDIRANVGFLNYGAISVLPGPNDTDPTVVAEGEPIPETELTRARDDSDSWSYIQLEPGISVTGQLFAEQFPRLAQRARFGIGLGQFVDQVNELDFLSITATFEADLEYQLFAASRWALRLGGAWQVGVLRRTDDIRSTDNRLPVSWLQASLSLVYAL